MSQVACEAAYYAVCVRRLRQEDQDVLVEFPRVERVVQRVHRVRPPHGFALAQDRQQARKVHLLHTMLKVHLRNPNARSQWQSEGRRRLLTSRFCLWPELPGLHALPAGGSPPQLLRLG